MRQTRLALVSHTDLVIGVKITSIIWLNFNKIVSNGSKDISISVKEYVNQRNGMYTVVKKKLQTIGFWII